MADSLRGRSSVPGSGVEAWPQENPINRWSWVRSCLTDHLKARRLVGVNARCQFVANQPPVHLRQGSFIALSAVRGVVQSSADVTAASLVRLADTACRGMGAVDRVRRDGRPGVSRRPSGPKSESLKVGRTLRVGFKAGDGYPGRSLSTLRHISRQLRVSVAENAT
jgi:hypothetical protein